LVVMLKGFGRQNSVRGAVIDLLSREWPLGFKEVHRRLEGKGVKCSGQAVHKMLKQLVEEEIISRKGRVYELNLKWVRSVSKFGRETERAYAGRKKA